MAVVISGTNNSDKITATDGLIDLLSSVNFASEVSVPSFKVGSDIQIGNAGIITATTLVGNVQGNINHTSNLLLQISGSEKFRVGTSGQLGIGGANYGTSGQVLTSGGSGSAATWSTISGTTINNNADNRIITGSGTANTLNGEANLTFDGTNLDLGSSQKIRIGDSQECEFYVDGNGLKIHSHNSNSQIELESDKQFYFKYVTSGGFHFIGAGQQVLSMYGGSGGGIYFRHNNSQKLKLEGGNFTYENGATVTHASHVYIQDSIIHVGDTDTKIRFPADNTVTVEAGGHERIRIASSKILKGLTSARGNYGNNTSGVEYGVQIEGTSAITAGLSIVRNSNDANDGGIVLGKTRATSTGGNTVVQAGDDLGNLTFAGSDGTSLLFGAEIFAEVESGVGNDDMPTALVFKTNSGTTSTTERLRIDSSGRVLIGTTTEGNESADDLTLANSTNCGLSIRSGTSSNGSVFFTDATSGADEYRGFIQYQHSNDRLYFGTATTSKMYIEDTSDNGDVHVQTGNIVFDTSGKGIDFSATGGGDLGGSGTSELLDDYEEGTCTFTFVPASGSYGAVYTTGHYTKIGDIVHVTGSISINGQTSASGEVQISGLPFSVRGVNSTWSGEGGHGTGRWFYGGPNHFVHLVCDNSTDRMRVHKGDGTFLNHTDMNTSYNASQYSFTATYFHA